MKKHHLYLIVRITVNSKLSNLSQTIQEFEQETNYSFSDTENVKVEDTEILETEVFYPKN